MWKITNILEIMKYSRYFASVLCVCLPTNSDVV
jgi:hypothetical protein